MCGREWWNRTTDLCARGICVTTIPIPEMVPRYYMRHSELVFFCIFVLLLLIPDVLAKQWTWVGLWSTVVLVTLGWEYYSVSTTGQTLSQARWALASVRPTEAWINAGFKIAAMVMLAWHLVRPFHK